MDTEQASVWTLFSWSNFGQSGLIQLGSSVGFMLMTLLLAFPLTVKDLPGRRIYFALLIIVLDAGGMLIEEFQVYSHLNLNGTLAGKVLSGIFSVFPVFILSNIASSKIVAKTNAMQVRGEFHRFFRIFLPACWKPLVALGVLHLVNQRGNESNFLLFVSDSDTPMLILQQAMKGIYQETQYDPVVLLLQYGAMITIPAIVLVTVFCKWLSAAVLASHTRGL